ncbi:big defensin-like isoform X2 [Branchiostoma floridae x Branchiostoma belcheri]
MGICATEDHMALSGSLICTFMYVDTHVRGQTLTFAQSDSQCLNRQLTSHFHADVIPRRISTAISNTSCRPFRHEGEKMEKKTAYCLLFLVLLVPYTALGAVLKRAPQQEREKRVPAIPLVYWGATVSPSVWYWLLAAFGAAAVTAAGTKLSDREGHPCGGFWNQGYCRTACFPHEYIDDYHSAVCNEAAGYKCCRPR